MIDRWADDFLDRTITAQTQAYVPGGQGDLAATAGGLFEAQYLGASTSSPSFQAGLGFLYREWGETSPCAIANDSVAYYALSVALRATSTPSLSNYSCSGAPMTARASTGSAAPRTRTQPRKAPQDWPRFSSGPRRRTAAGTTRPAACVIS